MSRLCYDNKDFELSSYLIQQSLEKSIKAFLLKKRVIADPEELRHLPLHRIFSLLKDDLKRRKKHHQNQKHLLSSYENCILLIGKMTDLFDDIKKSAKKSKTKIPIWKESLGIPLTGNEPKIMEYWMGILLPDTKRIIGSLGKFVGELTESNYDEIAKNFGVSKESIKKYASLVSDKKLLDSLQNSNFAISDDYTKVGFDLLKQFEQSSNFTKSSSEQMSTNVIEPIIFVIQLRDLIVKTVIHEDIGRYPILLDDGKTSTKWYEEKHEKLKDLINQVETKCVEISMWCR